MKYYAVIDTNVVVSAMLRWDSVPGNVMDLVFSKVIIPVLNEDILREYREVLSRPKFHFTKDIIDPVIDNLMKNGVFVDEQRIDIDLPDPKDKVFYEVVMDARKREDSYLVTGNIKHFPQAPFIVTPREMMDIIINHQSNDEV